MAIQIDEIQRSRSRDNNDRRSNDRGRNNNRSRSRSRPRYDPEMGICWYHFRFGADATKCVKPCKLSKN